MQLPQPSKNFAEYNLNTIVTILGFLSTFALGVTAWNKATSSIEDLQDWRLSLEQNRKDTISEFKRDLGNVSTRVDGNEKALLKMDNIQYRLTVAEQNTATTSQSIRDLQESLNDINGDVRVIREILTRIDSAANGPKKARYTLGEPIDNPG